MTDMEELNKALDRHSRELLPTLVRVFVFIYVIIGGAHLVVLPEGLLLPLSGLAFGSVFVGFLINLNIEREFVLARAELFMVLLLGLMGLNTMVHLYLSADLKQTTNLIFILAISGYVLPAYRTFYPTVFTLTATWSLFIATSNATMDESIHFGFEVMLGLMFAVFLHTVRRRQLEQMSDLEQTIDRLNQTQAQLVAGESLLQTLMDNIPAGIIVRDLQTRIQFMNAEATALLRTEGEGLLGKQIGEDALRLCDQTGRRLTERELPTRRVIETGEPVDNEIVGALQADGDITWALLNAFPLQVDGTGDSMVVLAFTNITEQVKAEMQLDQSENRARTILNSVIEGVISVDSRDVITLFNPGAEQMTGYQSEFALGQSLSEVFRFEPEEGYLDLPGDTIRLGRLWKKSGELVAAELLISEVRGEDGSAGKVYTFRDVSEQQRLEQERSTMDKMSSVGVLAGGIAHDFNNLLTAIYGNVALAEASINNPERAAGFLKRSSESIEMATNLTKQLLTFATGSDPVRDVVDIERLIREATRFSLSGSSIVVTFDIAPDVDAVEVDAGQVQQAIGNTVLNAKQAMNDAGGIHIGIANVDVQGQRFVEVSISDEGPGIPAEALPNIFDPYFTTKDSGTGLGLTTTHSIVVKHGGTVRVDSSPGKGTTFYFRFPSSGESLSQIASVTPTRQLTESGLNVLVMDDEDVVLQTISRLLEHLGHRVVATKDGAEAIAAYSEQLHAGSPFDFVVMDLTVAGGMGGKVAAERILAIDPDARLVVSSGYSSGAEMARFRDFGFCARLEKPFLADDLARLVADVMS